MIETDTRVFPESRTCWGGGISLEKEGSAAYAVGEIVRMFARIWCFGGRGRVRGVCIWCLMGVGIERLAVLYVLFILFLFGCFMSCMKCGWTCFQWRMSRFDEV